VEKDYYYIVVETPDGNWGLDKIGIYLEHLQPWQVTLVSNLDCEGHICNLIGCAGKTSGIELAALRLRDNFICNVECGRCKKQWTDGIRYQNLTYVRCPGCRTINCGDSSMIEVVTLSKDALPQEKSSSDPRGNSGQSPISPQANTTVFKEKGIDLINQKKYDEARPYLEKALSHDPSDKEIHFLIGNTALMRKNYAEAKSFYKKALEIDPNYLGAMRNMLLLLTLNIPYPIKEAPEYKEALNILDRLIVLYPTHNDIAEWWYERGQILDLLDLQPEEQYKAYINAIEINPDKAKYWEAKGDMLRYFGRYIEAINDYQRALQIEPKPLFPSCKDGIEECKKKMKAK
jgi:tetratricopeptide (TPR) repeat protein